MLPNLDAQRCREIAQNLEVINAEELPGGEEFERGKNMVEKS